MLLFFYGTKTSKNKKFYSIFFKSRLSLHPVRLRRKDGWIEKNKIFVHLFLKVVGIQRAKPLAHTAVCGTLCKKRKPSRLNSRYFA